ESSRHASLGRRVVAKPVVDAAVANFEMTVAERSLLCGMHAAGIGVRNDRHWNSGKRGAGHRDFPPTDDLIRQPAHIRSEHPLTSEWQLVNDVEVHVVGSIRESRSIFPIEVFGICRV